MKVIATLLSLSLTAMLPVLPVAAQDTDQSTSDRATWIEQSLSSIGATKSTSSNTSAGTHSGSTSSTKVDLSRSVANLYPGVKMRKFVPNRYLPSEHDLELAQAQARAVQVQLNAGQQVQQPAQAQAMQAQANTSRSPMISMNSRVNTLAPAIFDPSGNTETIGQIRSMLRSRQGGQLIADAALPGTNGGANLYPDVVGPVPTQATAAKPAPFPLNFLAAKSTRQFAGATTSASYTRANLPAATLGGWRTQTQSMQAQQQFSTQQIQPRSSSQYRSGQAAAYKLPYSGFQTYTGKLHTQPVKVTGYPYGRAVSSANTDASTIAAAPVATYTPYASAQSSALPY